MRLKIILTALIAVGAAFFANSLWSPAHAMGPVAPSAVNKTDNSLVEKVHRRRYYRGYRGYRGYGYYPSRRWYGYRYRPYYAYGAPYYYSPYYYPYYRSYYGPRYYGGVGIYGPRFGLRIGF